MQQDIDYLLPGWLLFPKSAWRAERQRDPSISISQSSREVAMPDQTVELRDDIFTVPGLFIASVVLQPSPSDNAINVTVRGIPFIQDVRRVFLQVRQSVTDTIFSDQFSTQVIR